MIEIPKELQRFVIKEKFLGKKAAMMEANLLATKKEVKKLKSKIEELVDIEFIHEEPEIDVNKYDFSVGWVGNLNGVMVRVDLIWGYSNGTIRNIITSIDESGEEEVLLEL